MRNEVLAKLNIKIPEQSIIRVFIDTDAKNEADDQYAITHFLLSPSFDVVGISSEHFFLKGGEESEQRSYKEIKKILHLLDMEDIPCYSGASSPIKEPFIQNDASKAIIEEAKKGKLYVVTLGAVTNLALALKKEPSIAKNIIVLFNGGAPYNEPRFEFNVMQDVKASQILFDSDCEIYQTPQNVYNQFEVTLSELKDKVYPCGEIGKYLYEQLEECNLQEYNPHFLLRTGENWTLGDNAPVAVLLMNRFRDNSFDMMNRPSIDDQGNYVFKDTSRKIRVYKSLDVRMTLEDLYAKLKLISK